jgi:hypothetical protein
MYLRSPGDVGRTGYDAAVNAISDPGRPSRRDRRRAQKLVDTAFAESRLTAADRTLRTQRIQAAHTRGDLATITRDLVAPVPTNLGRALDPSTMSSMRPGTKAGGTSRLRGTRSRIPGIPATISPGTPTIDLSGIGRRVRLFVLIAVVGLFASCVLGLAAFLIPAFLTESDRGVNVSPADDTATIAPNPRQTASQVAGGDSSDLHTAAGWTELVEAIKSESGTTEVYDLVAYPQYASVGLDGEDAVERRFYRNGAWQDSVSVRTPIAGSPIDLADIDADLIARLPGETARHFEIDDPTGTYIIVNAFAGAPQIAVYVQSNGESRYRAYRLDGTPKS